MSPKVAVADKDIRGYTTQWEKELEFYHKATGKSAVDADQHRMFMLNMCSSVLRTHLRYRRMIDAEISVLRVEIADYLHETLPQGKGGRLAALDGAPGALSSCRGRRRRLGSSRA